VLPTEIVQTIDYVEREYNNDWIYEMEAAGFYNTVSRFTTSELIQCIKIISDNQSSSTEKVSAKQVESLVEGNLEAIERVVLGLDALAKELESRERAPEKFEHVLKKFHFTVTEQRKLKRLLKRLETLDINPEIWESQISQLKNTNGVIRALEAQIEATPLQL
jgi:adenosylhomocysteine nucleosidase